MRRLMRVVMAIAAVLLFGTPLAACAGDDLTPEQQQAQEAAEAKADAEEEARDTLGIAMDKGGWNEAERTFTEGDKAFGIVSTGQVHCSAKFTLIPGTGETKREKRESAGFTLVAVVADMDGNGAIPLAKLPEVLRDAATGLSKGRFDKLIKQTRGSNEALKAICGNR